MIRFLKITLLLFASIQTSIFAQSTSSTKPGACQIGPGQLEALLALPFMKFDQDQNGGWREVSNRGCKLEASLLIDAYLADAPSEVSDLEKGDLYFHAGQLLAMSGQYNLAISHMLRSFNPRESSDTSLAWNTYVLATTAFLAKDKQRLLDARNRLASSRKTRENGINLNVVDGLLHCFDQPYAIAYGTACRPK